MVLDKNNSKGRYANGKVSDYLGAGLNTLTGLAPSIYNYFKGQEKPKPIVFWSKEFLNLIDLFVLLYTLF